MRGAFKYALTKFFGYNQDGNPSPSGSAAISEPLCVPLNAPVIPTQSVDDESVPVSEAGKKSCL